MRIQFSMALGGQAVQFQPTTEDASKLNMRDTKEESLRSKCLTGRVLKGEQEQRAGGTLHPAGSSQHQELGCEPLEAHQPFCV